MPARVLCLLDEVASSMRDEARGAYPLEACGALLGRIESGRIDVRRLVPGSNIHSTPRTGFELHPSAVVAAVGLAREHGLELVGFFHSHPDRPPLPSPADLGAAWDGFVTVIVAVDDRGRTRTRGYLQVDGRAVGLRHA